MRNGFFIGAFFSIALAVGIIPAGPANSQSYYGHGMMGPGMMGPGMMGPGMMGPGMMGPGTMGPGMMGPGMMGPGMMGPGMMGPGMMMGPGGMMGPGMTGPGIPCPWCGPGWSGAPANLQLAINDVRSYLERWLAWTGASRLKVGNVAESDGNTITADIVTREGNSLVQRFAVDRRSGSMRSVE